MHVFVFSLQDSKKKKKGFEMQEPKMCIWVSTAKLSSFTSTEMTSSDIDWSLQHHLRRDI